MGYCTKQELIQALANALSQGNPTTPGTLVPITSIGNMVTDTVGDDQIFQYIVWADENIDASISSIYETPLTRINLGSYPLAADITAGDDFLLLQDVTRFTEGDLILLRDRDAGLSQQLTIETIPSTIKLTFTTPITNSYSMNTGKVERIRYPDPIPKMSARLAASYLYDKHFAAQVDGNKSDFGKHLRDMVHSDMNGIMAGTIRLAVPDAGKYVGRRFYNHALDDVIATKAKPGEKWFGGEA
jgi:hypothetical protein